MIRLVQDGTDGQSMGHIGVPAMKESGQDSTPMTHHSGTQLGKTGSNGTNGGMGNGKILSTCQTEDFFPWLW